MKKKKNYYRNFLWAAIVLLIAAIIIYHAATENFKWLTFLPVALIIPLGIWRIKKEEKQNSIPPSYNYRYRYESKGK